MKLDVLDSFESITACVGYLIDDKETEKIPLDLGKIDSGIYKDFDGWNSQIEDVKNYSELPKPCRDYIEFIEDWVGVPIKLVSVGPDRESTIEKNPQ